MSNSFLHCEEERLKKLKNYQLPNSFKKVGITITILSFAGLLINIFSFHQIEIKTVCKYGMLLGLLLVSISKEKIEDELLVNLRMQSFSLAFICGVAYAIVIPFIVFLINYFFEIRKPILKDLGDFSILWMLLSIQVLYFEFLKRMHK